MVLKIVAAPNSVLSQPAKKVSKIDKNILRLIEEMKKSLLAAKDPEGVGLAAPQVGKSLQIFLAKPMPKSDIEVFINPKIIHKDKKDKFESLTLSADRRKELNADFSEKQSSLVKQSEKTAKAKEKSGIDKNIQLEGCLSLPNVWGEVNRSPMVTLSYLDEDNKARTRKFKEFVATIIQHEMDHLNGILFPKRVLEQKGKLYKSRRNEKGEDVFEDINI